MAKKENNYYFESFAKGIAFANQAAALLQEVFASFDAKNVKAHLDEMHTIEHTADGVKHEMRERLMKEFLPPIEREDIMELSHTIDDVIDSIEDILCGMYMYNITALRPEARSFADVISRCCAAMTEMMAEFSNYKKSATIQSKIVEVNGLEEEGDRLYVEAMHRLYAQEKDPVQIVAWTKLYGRLEKVCDSCEDVADMVEQVIMKNS